ncbi:MULTISPECIES: mannitol dehydrogenase family protein [unclassified Streptomyces]|uniref:mannitol dehydrogenase family protein n=1 Tax=unclassified Streptomyces TaxID=2593676 RepID=UPI0036FC80AE
MRLLDQATAGAPSRAPVRIIHLGLGAFHRAHQAWYTHRADHERQWGIAAFTGRRPAAAHALAAQNGLYSVIERSAAQDRVEVVGSITEAHDGADRMRLRMLAASPQTAAVTLTVTEAGYHLGADGELDLSAAPVRHDVQALRRGADGALVTAPARLLDALSARRRTGAGGMAVISCDNLPGNGAVTHRVVRSLSAALDEELADWIDAHVSFVSTSVDRITPATTVVDTDLASARLGLRDLNAVVTEPFHSWVLAGRFPAGRPPWEQAGALFVDDIGPYERRKLWLLNGAHSLLAYMGLARGHETVAEAIRDPSCERAVDDLWGAAARHLDEDRLDIPAYRRQLLDRFRNPRIAHRLAQIAMDGSTKLRARLLPVVRAEQAAGHDPEPALRCAAAWAEYVLTAPDPTALPDSAAPALARACALAGDNRRLAALLSVISPAWGEDPAILTAVNRLRRSPQPRR